MDLIISLHYELRRDPNLGQGHIGFGEEKAHYRRVTGLGVDDGEGDPTAAGERGEMEVCGCEHGMRGSIAGRG